VQLDDDANQAHMPTISGACSRVCVAVEPTNEEWIAAGHAARVIGAGLGAASRAERAASIH
jgi:acetate kinase